MDMTRSNLARPKIVVEFSPIHWEPFSGTGERVVALIAIQPHLASLVLTSPSAYVVLPRKRLIAMLGNQRGNSAHAILQEAAITLSKQLETGLDLTEIVPSFMGFTIGRKRKSSGWTIEQVLHSAVNSCCAFGNTDEIVIDEPEDARHIATTRNFLSSLRAQILAGDKEKKERFNKRLSHPDTPDITIDYCHLQLLVQVTSLPTSRQQELQLQREAESKLLELSSAVKHLQGNQARPTLLVNAEALKYSLSDDSKLLADNLLDRFRYFASQVNTELITVESPAEAVQRLERLEN